MSHPNYIHDLSLKGYRDRLLWLLEKTWPEVGLTLQTAKKPEDLCYPSMWGEQRSIPVVEALLHLPKRLRRTDADGLHKMRNGISLIDDSIKNAYEDEKECKERLEIVEVAFTQEITADQRTLLSEKREERLQKLADATAQRAVWDDRRREAVADLKDCEAHFARTEVIKFRKNRRYTKNPLNTANAFAGLPFIGWRQSVKRCQTWEAHVDGTTTKLLRVVSRIVESWNQNVALKMHADNWLRQGHCYHPAAQAELRKEFFYFRRAIDEVSNSNQRRKLLPYLVISEYQRRISNRSPVDRLFEEEERIVLKPKKNTFSQETILSATEE